MHPERESKAAILLLFGAIPNQGLIASVRRRSRWLFERAVARILGSLFSFFSSRPFSSSILPPFTMHFLSAVQVPLSATIVRGGTSSVPEMVLSSMHPPASSPGNERAWAGLWCWWGEQRCGTCLPKMGRGAGGWLCLLGGHCSVQLGLVWGAEPSGGPARVCPLCYWKNKHCKICLCGFSPFSEILLRSKARWLFLSSLLTAAVPELCSGH